MSGVIPLRNLRETGEDFLGELSPEQTAAKILERELPHLCNDVAMLIGRPFRFIWDPTIETASTDCLAEVRVAPRPFIEGEREVGYGTVYHETGHIRASPYGARLLTKAHQEGGQVLQHLANIVLDRKDDYETAEHAPGFADVLRRRLLSICTMARRKRYADVLTGMSPDAQARFLRHAPPGDAYEDFFLVAKWHKRPRFRATRRAMKLLLQKRLRQAGFQELLWITKRVREILGDLPEQDTPQAEEGLIALYSDGGDTECGAKGDALSPELLTALNSVLGKYVAALRKAGVDGLVQKLKSLGINYPGPLSVGLESDVPLITVEQSSQFTSAYNELLAPVEHQVGPLKKKLRKKNQRNIQEMLP